MALVSSGTFGSPVAAYELHASERAPGSGNTRYLTVTFKIKINSTSSGSTYGYALDWKGRAKDTYSSWAVVKSSTDIWKGGMAWKSYSWNVDVNVGSTSATNITIGFETRSTDFPSTSWAQTRTGTFTTSQTLTKPDTVTGMAVKGYFEEGETQTITWNAMPRASYYKVWYKVRYISTGAWSDWMQHGGNITGTSYSIKHVNVGENNYGAIYYCVNAYNAAGVSPDNKSSTYEHCGVRAWNGSAWVWKQMNVWNGSSWVKTVPKIWNGSAWKYT